VWIHLDTSPTRPCGLTPTYLPDYGSSFSLSRPYRLILSLMLIVMDRARLARRTFFGHPGFAFDYQASHSIVQGSHSMECFPWRRCSGSAGLAWHCFRITGLVPNMVPLQTMRWTLLGALQS
jgi:hypothetical protein